MRGRLKIQGKNHAFDLSPLGTETRGIQVGFQSEIWAIDCGSFQAKDMPEGKALYMDRGPAPQGLQDSAQSFNPGNPQNKRFALIRRYLVAPCWKNTRVRRVGGAEGARDAGTR
jgi:hypothetical protein